MRWRLWHDNPTMHADGSDTWIEIAVRKFLPSVADSLFELFIGIAGTLIGLPLLMGVIMPTSINDLLPGPGIMLYAASLLLGGLTTIYGAVRRFPFVTSMGLQLLSGAFAIYAVAVLVYVGPTKGGFVAAITLSIAAFCAVRAFFLRALIRIRRRVAKSHGVL